MGYPQRPSLPVQSRPVQAQDLTTAHPVGQGQDHRRLEPVSGRSVQQLARLVDGQRAAFPGPDPRHRRQHITCGPLPTPETVKAGLTSKRPRRQVENDEYAAFVQRILRTYSRRVGDGDVEALALMLGLAEDVDAAIAVAVKGLRERGDSWAEIGSRLGITRQAAHQRWG